MPTVYPVTSLRPRFLSLVVVCVLIIFAFVLCGRLTLLGIGVDARGTRYIAIPFKTDVYLRRFLS